MSRDKWYISVLILAFLVLSVTLLLVRWHVLLGRVPLAPVTPGVASANLEPGAGVTTTAKGSKQPPPVTTRLDLNTATTEQLQALPGIGPVLAERLLDYRQRNGRFNEVDDLLAVEGIGAAKLADLRDLVTVTGAD